MGTETGQVGRSRQGRPSVEGGSPLRTMGETRMVSIRSRAGAYHVPGLHWGWNPLRCGDGPAGLVEQRKPAHLIVSLLCLSPFGGSHTPEKSLDSLAELARPSHPSLLPPHPLGSCQSSVSVSLRPARPLPVLRLLPGTPSCRSLPPPAESWPPSEAQLQAPSSQ